MRQPFLLALLFEKSDFRQLQVWLIDVCTEYYSAKYYNQIQEIHCLNHSYKYLNEIDGEFVDSIIFELEIFIVSKEEFESVFDLHEEKNAINNSVKSCDAFM